MKGEAKGGDKFSAANAAQKLKVIAEIKTDWYARLACSEAEVKRVFTSLSQQKKKADSSNALKSLATDSEVEEEEEEDEELEPAKPRRRGRPRKVQNEPTEEEFEDPDDVFAALEDAEVPDSQLIE